MSSNAMNWPKAITPERSGNLAARSAGPAARGLRRGREAAAVLAGRMAARVVCDTGNRQAMSAESGVHELEL